MRKTRASQASSSEKLTRLKQELVTATDLVSAILKREQLKREASQQAKAVWEKREDFANLKRKFPSLLNAKEDEELFYDKERVVKKPRPAEQSYAPSFLPSMRAYGHFSRIGVKLKARDNTGDLVSPGPLHDVVRPKERAATILAQVDREMARIKERDHHWEDGIEVSRLRATTIVSTHIPVECVSTSTRHSSPAPLQVGPVTRCVSIVSTKIQLGRGALHSTMACCPGTSWPRRRVACRPSHPSPVSSLRRAVALPSALIEHR
jgi:hypothetical protein